MQLKINVNKTLIEKTRLSGTTVLQTVQANHVEFLKALRKENILSQKSAEYYGLEEEEMQNHEESSEQQSCFQFLLNKEYLKPLIVGCTMQIIQQLTGLINVVK